jgi:hypothetical protein
LIPRLGGVPSGSGALNYRRLFRDGQAGDELPVGISLLRFGVNKKTPDPVALPGARRGCPLHAPILAATPVPEIFRQLNLHRAVSPFLMPFDVDPDVMIEWAISMLGRAEAVAPGDKLVIVSDFIA